jgi:hypothetical protein
MLFVSAAARGALSLLAAGWVILMALLAGFDVLLVRAALCRLALVMSTSIFVALLTSLHVLLVRAAARILFGHV